MIIHIELLLVYIRDLIGVCQHFVVVALEEHFFKSSWIPSVPPPLILYQFVLLCSKPPQNLETEKK